MNFTYSLLWVQVHNMPIICMNHEVGHRIGAILGMVEEVDVTGDGVGWERSLRLRVNIDLTKPLDRGRALHLNEKTIWVTFKYEKLPQFCYINAVGSILRVPVAKAAKGFGSMMRGHQNNGGFGQTTSDTGRVDHQRLVQYKQNPHRTLMDLSCECQLQRQQRVSAQ
jgi:hypothetical protein